MASLTWVKGAKCWRVRWRATNRRTHEVFSGSQTFINKPEAALCWAHMEGKEERWRLGISEESIQPDAPQDRPTIEDARLLTQEAVADLLAVTTDILRQWRKLSQGPRFYIMETEVRYRLADLLEWEKQTLVPVDPTPKQPSKD